jgi:uncharacterized membrane protein
VLIGRFPFAGDILALHHEAGDLIQSVESLQAEALFPGGLINPFLGPFELIRFFGYFTFLKYGYLKTGEDEMMKIIMAYIATAVVFFAIDIVWLGFVAKDLYRRHLGSLLRPDVNWTAAGIFYLLYIAGILIFAVYPAVNRDSFTHALVMGGLFGFFAYATYDLTNLATLRDWPVTISLIDMAWGAFLTGAVSSISFFIVRSLR